MIVMIEVEVRNFQSIEHTSIRIDGFTALVGRSNIGKSALVRAVKSALTGASGTSFVRHGMSCARRTKNSKTCDCFATVCIRTNGFDLRWEKGDKRNRYEFNGQVYDRTEQGTPDFLLRPNLPQDFGTVEVARKEKLLQVADQFDNVFLVDQTGNVVADVLSDVARLDRVNVAIRMIEKDRREAASTRKVYEKECVELSAKDAAFDGLEGVMGEIQLVEAKLNEITKSQREAETISGYLGEIAALGFRIEGLQKACQVNPPDPSVIARKREDYERVLAFLSQSTEKESVVANLAGVETVAEPNLSSVVVHAQQFGALSGWLDKLRAFQTVFNAFKTAENVSPPNPEALNVAKDKYLALHKFTSKYGAINAQLKELQASYDAVNEESAEIVKEIEALGLCPTCVQPVSATHLHRIVA